MEGVLNDKRFKFIMEEFIWRAGLVIMQIFDCTPTVRETLYGTFYKCMRIMGNGTASWMELRCTCPDSSMNDAWKGYTVDPLHH